MRRFIGLLIISFSTIALLDVRDARADRFEVARYEKACTHYVNRAMFRERTTEPAFVVVLADSCLPALKSLRSPHFREKLAAADYLGRLLQFRDTIIEMNMERVFGKAYSRWTRMKSQRDDSLAQVPKVSETGEYLIAYRMGLLDAYRAWLDTGPKLALRSDLGARSDERRP